MNVHLLLLDALEVHRFPSILLVGVNTGTTFFAFASVLADIAFEFSCSYLGSPVSGPPPAGTLHVCSFFNKKVSTNVSFTEEVNAVFFQVVCTVCIGRSHQLQHAAMSRSGQRSVYRIHQCPTEIDDLSIPGVGNLGSQAQEIARLSHGHYGICSSVTAGKPRLPTPGPLPTYSLLIVECLVSGISITFGSHVHHMTPRDCIPCSLHHHCVL